MHAIGIDIGGGAWAVAQVTVSHDGGVSAIACSSAAFGDEIDVPADAVVIIDSPIGFISNASAKETPRGRSGDRPVDVGARKWCLSSSSVFHPPTEEQFTSALQEHERARATNAARLLANVAPGGMSKQCLELVPAMESARKLKARFPSQVFESHPEVVFTALANGKVPAKKTSLFGALVRVGLLAARLRRDVLSLVFEMESKETCAPDNWLDALSMAVVAVDWAMGRRHVLRSRDGKVHAWSGETDGLIALPLSDLTDPPGLLSYDQAKRWVAPCSAHVA